MNPAPEWTRYAANVAALGDARTDYPPDSNSTAQPGYTEELEVLLPVTAPNGARECHTYRVHVVPFTDHDDDTGEPYGCTWYVVSVELPSGYALRRTWLAYLREALECLYPETASQDTR